MSDASFPHEAGPEPFWCVLPDGTAACRHCGNEVTAETCGPRARAAEGMSNLLHLHAPTPAARDIQTTAPEPRETIRPRVAIETAGGPIAQVTHDGVEWMIERVAHVDDGAELVVTIRGPLRSLAHGSRAEQGARFVGEVVRRIRGRER